jgi:hypothetical protein
VYCYASLCGRKDSVQRIFVKKCFPFMSGSVCRLKRFHLGGKRFADAKRLKQRRGRGGDNSQKTFRRTGEAMGQVYQYWWRICREINVFFQFLLSHVLRFISIRNLFTDSPSY